MESFFFHFCNLDIDIVAISPVADENRHEKPKHHTQSGNQGGFPDIHLIHCNTGLGHGLGYDAVENQSEAHRQHDIGCFQTEGQGTGGRPAVQFHFIEEQEQRRDQDRNECDVDWDEILGERGYAGQNQEEDPFAVKLDLGKFADQKVGNAGVGDGHGHGSQKDIGQRCFSRISHSADERSHDIGDPHAGQKTGHQSRNKNCDKDVDLDQT